MSALCYNCPLDIKEIGLRNIISECPGRFSAGKKGMTFIVRTARAFFAAKDSSATTDWNRVAVVALTVSIFLPFYICIGVVCYLALMTMVQYRLRLKAFSAPYTKLLFAFLAAAFFVAAVYNNYQGMAYSILIYAVVTCGLYLRSVMTRQLFNQAMDTACVCSIWCVLIALCQKAYFFAAAPDYRPVSVFTNTNFYGMVLEFVIIIALYRAFTNPEHLAFYGAVLGLNFIGLYLTGSYSSFAAMLCAVLVMLGYKRKTKLTAAFLLGTAAYLALCVLVPSFAPRGAGSLETTFAQRVSIWETSLRGIEEHPLFGMGASAYQMIYEQFGGYKTYHCHNLLLDILLNFGVVGLAVLCIYGIALVRLLILRFRNNVCTDMNVLAAAAMAAVLVHGMTDVTILWAQTAALFFLILSSFGIGSAFLEENIMLPNPLAEYADDRAGAVYLRN
ncbi:MAG TPA: O-antigen ligase [Ruminococcaceae bacterium]|nr:O-antigen ligase [Oscillospiraceae bacterium]HBQ47215.1 O-antigen ligase [Oscillospiraceae bacterium]HBT90638.1 O-antigen ligase [Oscillospiraceae bacterium]